MPKKSLTFRNPKLVYYGPHECSNCGVMVAKMGAEFGGNSFNYPEGPVYPNSEWQPHVCDPDLVSDKTAQFRKADRVPPGCSAPKVTKEDLISKHSQSDKTTFNYQDPTPEMLQDPRWLAIWHEIKTWDIGVPTVYAGYSGATGNHVTAIFLALKSKGLIV